MSIKIENTQVFGWEAAIRGARNPMNSWGKSDTCFDNVESEFYTINDNNRFIMTLLPSRVDIGSADHKLLMNLCKGGTEEAKWRRMVHVQMDVTAPLYWWKEFETYKIATVSNSCSTMHKIHAKEFTLDDFSCEHLFSCPENMPDFSKEFVKDMDEWRKREKEIDPNFFSIHPEASLTDVNPLPQDANERKIDWHYENGAYDAYEDYDSDGNAWVDFSYALGVLHRIIKALNYYREKFIETKDKKYWWQMIQLLPTSYNQKRTIDLNYEVLAAQYRQRKDHKLDCWREYCNWIRSLPYSEFITMEETE